MTTMARRECSYGAEKLSPRQKNGSSDAVLYKENYRQLLELIEKIMDLIQEPLVMKESVCL